MASSACSASVSGKASSSIASMVVFFQRRQTIGRRNERTSSRLTQKILASCSGHQRTFTLPTMYFFGTEPQWRLSELLLRWSPMTK